MTMSNSKNLRSAEPSRDIRKPIARVKNTSRFAPIIEGMEDRRLMAYSATLVGNIADFTGADDLSFAISGGLYYNNQFSLGTAGFESPFDFDSVDPGIQTLAVGSSAGVNVNATGLSSLTIDQSVNSSGQKIGFSTSLNPSTFELTGNVDTSIGYFTYNSGLTELNYQGGAGGNTITIADKLEATVTVVDAGQGSDIVNIIGTSGVDSLAVRGQDGNDLIQSTDNVLAGVALGGGTGNDTLKGGAGNDVLDGGIGDDTYLLSTGNDTIIDSAAVDSNQIVARGTVLGDNITIDQVLRASDALVTISVNGLTSTMEVTGVSVIQLYAGDGSDNVFLSSSLDAGGSDANAIGVRSWLGQGDDFIDTTLKSVDAIFQASALGEIGNDTFQGGAGSDAFYGGEDSDTYIQNGPLSIGSYFEGNTGINTLFVQASNTQIFADLSNTLHTVINGNTDPQLLSNSVNAIYLLGTSDTSNAFDILDLSNTTVETLTVQAVVGAANTATYEATQGDDNLRVDATATPDSLQIIGLPYYSILLNFNNSQDVMSLNGLAGNDSLEVTANNSSIINYTGGVGNDTLLINPTSAAANFVGGSGEDKVLLNGSNQSDTIAVTETATQTYNLSLNGVTSTASGVGLIDINGFAGDDSITATTLATASAYPITILASGGIGNDTVNMTGVNNGHIEVFGGSNSDTITGPTFAIYSELNGGSGNDTITGGGSSDLINGDSGDDFLSGLAGNDSITGDGGNDIIVGGLGDDSLSGGDSSDVFIWNLGDGNDVIGGGQGQDALVFNGSATTSNVFSTSSIPGPAAPGIVGPGLSNLALIQIVGNGSASATDLEHVSLVGGSGGDTFNIGNMQQTSMTLVDAAFAPGSTGNVANVSGTDVGDTIVITTPAPGQVNINGLPALVRLFNSVKPGDTLNLDAGAGNDNISITPDAFDQILTVINGGDGNDFIDGFNIVNGGNGNDSIYGTGLNDVLNGGNGNDSIDGGEGNDLLLGGAGNDFINGGDGNDSIWGEAGNDSLIGGLGNDMMYGGLGNDNMLGGTPETANIKHKPRKSGLPNDGNDTMLGGNGFDKVDGGNGDNLLDAGADNIRETVLGGSGNDMAFTHQATEKNYDRTALDGGFQHIYKQGVLSEPPTPTVPVNANSLSYRIPAFYYTGHIFSNGNVVEQPPLSEMIARGRTVITTSSASVKSKVTVKAASMSAHKLTPAKANAKAKATAKAKK